MKKANNIREFPLETAKGNNAGSFLVSLPPYRGERKLETGNAETAMNDYLDKLAALIVSGEVKLDGKVRYVTVQHDDWCRLLKDGSPCNCDPDVLARRASVVPGELK